MPAIRCKECSFVSAKNDGFCPECGAMYVEPFAYVDDSMVGSSQRPVTRTEKKKGGGLLSSLFGGGKRESEHTATAPPQSTTRNYTAPPTDVPRDQLKIRCQECRHIVLLDGHDGYCPDCGAFFVEPHEYITADSLAAEKAAEAAARESYRPVEKSFADMTDHEKLAYLKEEVADTWDQIIKDRHVLNEKANECMQCFTAAGTIKSEDQYEVLASTIKQRYHNLEDFELVYADYKRLLADFNKAHQKLLQAQQIYTEQERLLKQG